MNYYIKSIRYLKSNLKKLEVGDRVYIVDGLKHDPERLIDIITDFNKHGTNQYWTLHDILGTVVERRR